MKRTLIAAALGLVFFLRGEPLVAYVNGQNADYVIGQLDFNSAATGVGPSHLYQPAGTAYDAVHKRLFVSDKGNNRVLMFDLSGGITTNMSASLVLGQPDFYSNTPVTTPFSPTTLGMPGDLLYDRTTSRLYVADVVGARVLIFDLSVPANIHNGMAASIVLGKPTLNELPAVTSPSQSNLTWPGGLALDVAGKRLFVGDWTANRILVYDLSIPANIQNGMLASYVIGQTTFDVGSWSTNTLDQYSVVCPGAMAYDPVHQRLFVSNGFHHRIMVFDVSPGTLTMYHPISAINVLGQPDFFTQGQNTTATGMRNPGFMAFDSVSQHLFVSDTNNFRVLKFDLSGGITNNMPATEVLGQPDFTSANPQSTQNGMTWAEGLVYLPDIKRLFVADGWDHRILVFDPLACGGLAVCGQMTAFENPHPTLQGVIVELRDAQGGYIASTKTDDTGAYRFTDVSWNNQYYIVPILGRTQSAMPLQSPTLALNPDGANADFQIRGWPAVLNLSGSPPGSLVIVSTFNYTGPNPPDLSDMGSGPKIVSTTTDGEGTSTLRVHQGEVYITCWQATPTNASSAVNFVRAPTSGSKYFGTVAVNETRSVSCL